MIVITGGAYQGKRQFAIDTLLVDEDSIYTANSKTETIELTKHSTIAGLEQWVLAALDRKEQPVELLSKLLPLQKGCVIICDDISCGVVPIDPLERQHREAVGRCMQLLTKEADEVYRVFCGLGTRIK